jgi:hypothetical protein
MTCNMMHAAYTVIIVNSKQAKLVNNFKKTENIKEKHINAFQ